MSHMEILLCTLAMAVVSYIPRVLPPLVLAGRKLPAALESWLSFVPTSVFGALVFAEIFTGPEHTLNFSLQNVSLWASLLTVLVAARTKSLAWSIVTGLTAYWLLSQVLFL